MSSMSGSEIARLVLGYLQSQHMDKIALDFCKLSPYLREEYSILKRGLRIKQVTKPRTLIDIIKEFIEIEETVTEFFEHELEQHEQIPNELQRVKSLNEKVQYACRMFASVENNDQNQTQHNASVLRKRQSVCLIQSDDESDSTTQLSPRATHEKDLPGNKRPPLKRRKLYDPSLILTNKFEAQVFDNRNMEKSTANTPKKIIVTAQIPTCSKYLQASASKVNIPGEMLSKSVLDFALQDVIANEINEVLDNGSQLSDKIDDIVSGIAKNPSFEKWEYYIGEQSTYDHEFDDDSPTNDRQLNTPVPDEVTKPYNLRSQRKSNSMLNVSTESKRKKNSKVQIISDERANLPQSTLQTLQDGLIVVSDSDETVTTTSQQQQQQQSMPTHLCYIYNRDSQPFLVPLNSAQYVLSTVPSINQGQPQPQSISNINTVTSIPQIGNQSQLSVPADQFLSNVLNGDVLQQNQLEVVLNSDRYRCIVINQDDVNKEGDQFEPASQQLFEATVEVPQQNLEAENSENTQKDSDIPNQLNQNGEQAIVTPKQFIKPNILNMSKSLSPRSKNAHVRVLDFNLSGIPESRNESIAHLTRLNETPQNRSISSSMPSSAPSKINSIQNQKTPPEKIIESSSNEVFVPQDENTVVSAEGDTPKVRKTNRKSCVRTISAHKEVNPQEKHKRLTRVAKTKKKLCPEDSESNGSEASCKNEEAKAPTTSSEDALVEWQKIRSASTNPELFIQNLREQNSKKQGIQLSTGRKRRARRNMKKPIVKSKQSVKKTAADTLIKSADISMNSSLDVDTLNSTLTNLEARMLEENLKSAKKATPVKHIVIQKSAKKKTPIGKLQIKLIPSPKNKALKRLKNAKREITTAKLNDNADKTKKTTEADDQNKAEVEPSGSAENMTDDLEVAQNLISMQEVILQQESERKKPPHNPEIQINAISAAPTEADSEAKSEQMNGNTIDTVVLNRALYSNLNMSALLETPFKNGSPMFPCTPGANSIFAQLKTPLLRPCDFILDYSQLKNPQFPTPSFPITPGSTLTPLKDLISPRDNQDIVYGAANRPTDYSSSSSYYKPDESDGIDKQIHASIQSAQKNSGVYSAEEFDNGSKIDDCTQNTLNTSSSSSSSSSSSDSSSDSDTDSSSSDSDTSRNSCTAQENAEPELEHEPKPQAEPEPEPEPDLKPEPEPSQSETIAQSTPTISIEDDSTQFIKSHLVSTNEIQIAQNILLAAPDTAPVKSKEAEQIALLEEKRRRMQESLRQVEMKNHEKLKPKLTKKCRAISEAKRERFRAPPTVVSPSKRKSSQPKKIVSVHSRQIYSQVLNVVDTQPEKKIEVDEVKVQSVTTEQLITEAAGDNAIVDASDVSTTQNPQSSPMAEEESVEAIKSHINKSRGIADETLPVNKDSGIKSNLSPEGLVDMLSEKQKKFDANRPKMKTEVIAALPMARATRSRTRNQHLIRPVQNVITKPVVATLNSIKNTSASTESKISKLNKSRENKSAPLKKAKLVPNKAESTKIEEKLKKTASLETIESKSVDSLVTPAKEKRSRQIREIFGDCTDIETPIKSPPRNISKSKQTKDKTNAIVNIASNPSPQQIENKDNKFEADSSIVTDDNDDSDDDGSDDDTYEMIFSIDESDKKRFISLRENASVISHSASECSPIGTKKVVLPGNLKITLEPSEVMELYTQDVNSVVEMKKGRHQSNRHVQEPRTDILNQPSSSSEIIYEKPLYSSTPSPSKTVMPKFTVKHKSSNIVSPKSAKNQHAAQGENFYGIQIDDVLVQLHPTTD